MTKLIIDFQDYLEFERISFEWAMSYDFKDFDRLRKICAPEMEIDYRGTQGGGRYWPKMTADEFCYKWAANKGFLGDKCVSTQHLLGGASYERKSDTVVESVHQVRAAHQRWTSPEKTKVEVKGHGHAVVKHRYTKVNGEWKLSGIAPSVIFDEEDGPANFPMIFKHLPDKEEILGEK